jgi:hypothetical protein
MLLKFIKILHILLNTLFYENEKKAVKRLEFCSVALWEAAAVVDDEAEPATRKMTTCPCSARRRIAAAASVAVEHRCW